MKEINEKERLAKHIEHFGNELLKLHFKFYDIHNRLHYPKESDRFVSVFEFEELRKDIRRNLEEYLFCSWNDAKSIHNNCDKIPKYAAEFAARKILTYDRYYYDFQNNK